MRAGGLTPPKDYSWLPRDWATAVMAREIDVDALHARVDTIYTSHHRGGVSPLLRSDVFRAFQETPIAEVRFVILGEDPYPVPSQAHGLAFSVPGTYFGKRPSSLGRVFASLRRDLKINPSGDDLTPWSRRGVLLLNVALTHVVGDSQPDLATWEPFTTAILATVNDKADQVAWLLWGDFAIDHANGIPLDNTNHKRFENAHPRAGRARRPLLGAKPPFKAASSFLGSDPHKDWAI